MIIGEYYNSLQLFLLPFPPSLRSAGEWGLVFRGWGKVDDSIVLIAFVYSNATENKTGFIPMSPLRCSVLLWPVCEQSNYYMAVFCYDCSFLFLIQCAFRIVLVICLSYGTKKKKKFLKFCLKRHFSPPSWIYNLSLKNSFYCQFYLFDEK
jgi:hypothetical protein